MNIGIGRRRLVVNLIVEQPEAVADRCAESREAIERELSRIESRRSLVRERNHWESTATLMGIGFPR